MKPFTITLPHCSVYLDLADGYMTTTFADGTHVVARPGKGQGELWWLHDFLHSVMALAHGSENSPTLRAVAHGEPPTAEHLNEEKMILDLQRRAAKAMLESLR